jgi:hypothetical protein
MKNFSHDISVPDEIRTGSSQMQIKALPLERNAVLPQKESVRYGLFIFWNMRYQNQLLSEEYFMFEWNKIFKISDQ